MNIFANLLLSIVALVGVFLAAKGVRVIASSRESAQWPTTQATITKSEVESNHYRGRTTWHPILEYSYVIEGRQFTGSRVRMVSQLPRSERFARECVARYPVGSKVSVAYRSSDPALCALEPGLTRAAFLDLVGGLGFAIMALAMMYASNSERGSKAAVIVMLVTFAVWMTMMSYLMRG